MSTNLSNEEVFKIHDDITPSSRLHYYRWAAKLSNDHYFYTLAQNFLANLSFLDYVSKYIKSLGS